MRTRPPLSASSAPATPIAGGSAPCSCERRQPHFGRAAVRAVILGALGAPLWLHAAAVVMGLAAALLFALR